MIYLVALSLGGRWNQKFRDEGFYYSALTGICVGAGTIAFFLLFQKGGPLSAVPAILAGGCGNHGYRRNRVFSRAGVLATSCWYHTSNRCPFPGAKVVILGLGLRVRGNCVFGF